MFMKKLSKIIKANGKVKWAHRFCVNSIKSQSKINGGKTPKIKSDLHSVKNSQSVIRHIKSNDHNTIKEQI